MTSSDSAEDFESADEDFDLDHHSTHKTKQIRKDVCGVGEEIKGSEPSEGVRVNILQSFDGLNSQSPCVVKHAESECVNADKSCKVAEKSDEIRLKQSSKKLGTRLAANLNINTSSTSALKKSDILARHTGDNDDILSKGKETIENIPGEATEPSIHLTREAKIPTKTVNTKTTFHEPQSQPGDGWEVEEEDGFEIPATFAKLSDGGIHCAQDHISELDRVEFRQQQVQGWGGWGGWGVGSLLSTATGSVTALSSHVTAGLSTVLETTVGAPDPESLAAGIGKEHEKECPDTKKTEEPTNTEEKSALGYGGLGSIVSGVSFLSSSAINRGLDTLETLGKKTMEVLQHGDPGLKKKRAMLFPDQDRPVLSKILREAKEKADHSDKEKEEKETARKVHFESLFDDFHGMVHLEALEMLSTQCELKLQTLLLSQSGTQLQDLQETLSQVRDLCKLPDEEEDSEVLTREQFADQVAKCLGGLGIKISAAKIIQVNDDVITRLVKLDAETAMVVNQTAISSLAEFTAAAMECFHKSAELVLAKSLHNTADEAENYVQLTNHLCARVSVIANEFTQQLTKNNPIANSSFITNIFLEASNSSLYIRNACQLLVPILQEGTVSS